MKQLFLSLFFLGVSIGLFFVFIDPHYANVQTLQAQNASLSQALDKSRELQEVRDGLRARYNTFSPTDLQKLTKLLPDNIDNIRLILDIDAIAVKHSLRVEEFGFSEGGRTGRAREEGVTQEGPYGSVIFKFSVKSDYDTFRKFMDDLEKSLRIVDITSLGVVGGEGSTYTFNVAIRTYWLQ